MDMNKLFVYGTLKRAFREDGTLGAEFIGKYETDERWILFDFGPYPALIPGDSVVRGEVWEVPEDTLDKIDEYEGQQFTRREIQVRKGPLSQSWEWVDSYLFINTSALLDDHNLCTTWD